MTEQTRVESYMTMEGDKLVSYTYDAESEMWLKSEEDLAAMKAQMENLMGMALKLSDIPAEKMVLAEEQETVDGKSCYVLTVTLDGSYVQDGVSGVLEALPAELEEMDLSGLKDMDLSAMTIKTVFRVDAATFRPVQMDLEILGHPGGVFEQEDIAQITSAEDVAFLTNDLRNREKSLFLIDL